MADRATSAVKNEVGGKLDAIKDNLRKGISEPIKQYIEKKKQDIRRWTVLKTESVILSLLQKVQPKLKTGLKDDDMPDCVKDLVDDIVEEM